MKIKFLATGVAPNVYEFDGEKITIDGVEYELSIFREGDKFIGLEGDNVAIRDIDRVDGELYVTLCQKAPKGHWRGIDEYIDSNDYNPNELYIKEISEEEALQEQEIMQGLRDMKVEEKSASSSKGILKIRKASDI